MKATGLLAAFAVTAIALAQQPNTPAASLIVNGVNGPPFPISTTIEATILRTALIHGGPNAPYAIAQSATGQLQPGAAAVFGGTLDIPFSPLPLVVLDGFQPGSPLQTNGAGNASVSATYPLPAVGSTFAYQALLADPLSPYSYSLSAATGITVTPAPIITYYTLGDESIVPLSLASMPIPFYGNNYTTLYLDSNGYLCFGASDGGSYTPSPSQFISGPPRLAPFWCDLDCGTNAVRTTLNTNPGGTGSGVPGYFRIEYTNVVDWSFTVQHTFSMLMRSDGYLEITSAPTNNASIYDQITGIGPGGNLGLPQPQKNFVGAQPPGSTVGPGILTTPPYAYGGAVNEAFFEWFGIISNNPYYGNTYDNPFDLFAITLHFQPSGSGNLPGSTNRYTLN